MQRECLKKVGIITAGMTGGGTERVIAILANYLCEHGYELNIIMTANQRVDYMLNPAINVITLGDRTHGSIVRRIQRIFLLRKCLIEQKVDTVLSFGTETNLYTLLATIFMKINVVISERNDPHQCGYSKIRNILYRLADWIVFQTEEAKACFPKKIQSRSQVIANPISDNIPEVFRGKRKKNIIAVGRLENQKNHRLLIKSFSEFSKYYTEYQLEIYGTGELKDELVKLADKLEISHKVDLKGFSSNVLEEIRDAGMYVLSSDYEGVSNSLMEAMALGLPVIATDCPIGGAAMLIENRINGILVPVGDEVALTKAMLELAKNEILAQDISNRAIIIKNEYKKEKICEKWEKLIK